VHVANPTYEEACGTRTGHAEVVQVAYDPNVISFRDVLHVFFAIHDPTTKDRQGADIGPQYRSIILTHDPAQEAAAREVMAELTAARLWGSPFVTEIVPLTEFWPAEPEHHNYFARNPWSGYCQAVVAPKVAKFRKSSSKTDRRNRLSRSIRRKRNGARRFPPRLFGFCASMAPNGLALQP